MGTFGQNHEDAFTVLVNAQNIANGAEHTSGAISLDGKLGVLLTFEVSYGNPASAPVEFYFAAQTDDAPTYQVRADRPYGKAMAANTASTTHRDRITVPASYANSLKVITYNPSGAPVTVTLRYRLIEGATS